MKNFWATVWFWVKRVVVALGPFLLSLLSGAFFAALDALKAVYEAHQPLTVGSIWTVGGGAVVTYILLKAFSADKKDWIRAFLSFASAIMTPREALHEAASQVRPLTSIEKIEQKVLPAGGNNNGTNNS